MYLTTAELIGLALSIVLLVFVCGGCEAQVASQPTKLPTMAANVVDKGNGWITFNLDGQKYLYHRSHYGNGGYEAITAIPER